MRSLRRVLAIILRLIVVLLAEKLAPEPVLFLLLILTLIVGLVLRLGWLRQRSLVDRRRRRQYDALRRRWIHRPLPQTKNLLEHIPLVAHGVIAGVRGLCSVEKCRRVVLWTGIIGQQIGGVVEAYLNHTRRRNKVFSIRIFRQLHRVLHEVCKDGSGGVRALDLQVGGVVVD